MSFHIFEDFSLIMRRNLNENMVLIGNDIGGHALGFINHTLSVQITGNITHKVTKENDTFFDCKYDL